MSTQANTLEIDPAVQEITIGEQESVKPVTVTLTNHSDTAQSFEMLSLDIQQSNERGEIVFLDKPSQGSNTWTLSSFIEIPNPKITLEAQEKKELTVRIKNSVDLTPGGHYAALVIRQQPQANITDAQQLLQAVSSILLVRKVGGERYHLSLAAQKNARIIRFEIPSQELLLFTNEGNTHTVPAGTIEYRDMWGRVTNRGVINESSSTVLPQSKRLVTAEIKELQWPVPLMWYEMKIEGQGRPGDLQFHQTDSFLYVHPLSLLVPLLVLLIVVVYKLRRKK